ncbi:MAG: hypothetical protein KDE59_11030, partial [Anaerolineales bacterium]|nr:hypothetical protein [Anaerolineales bacterium]
MISQRRLTRIPLFFVLLLLPFLTLWQLRAVAAPAALVNLCSLPGAIIANGDFSFEGDDIVVSGCQGEINGTHSFNSLTVASGSLLRHGDVMTMSLTIASDVTVETGAVIDVSSRGYAGGQAQNPGQGPGGGLNGDGPGGGGGHGGNGGGRRDFFGNYVQYGPAYGDVHRPVTLGS